MNRIELYVRCEDGRLSCPHARADDAPCAARDGDSAVSIVGLCVGCGHSPADLLKELVGAVTTTDDRERLPAAQ